MVGDVRPIYNGADRVVLGQMPWQSRRKWRELLCHDHTLYQFRRRVGPWRRKWWKTMLLLGKPDWGCQLDDVFDQRLFECFAKIRRLGNRAVVTPRQRIVNLGNWRNMRGKPLHRDETNVQEMVENGGYNVAELKPT